MEDTLLWGPRGRGNRGGSRSQEVRQEGNRGRSNIMGVAVGEHGDGPHPSTEQRVQS